MHPDQKWSSFWFGLSTFTRPRTALSLSYTLEWYVQKIWSGSIVEDVGFWIGCIRLWFNPSQPEWLWMLDLLVLGTFLPSFVLDEEILPQTVLMWNPEVIPDSWLLLEEDGIHVYDDFCTLLGCASAVPVAGLGTCDSRLEYCSMYCMGLLLKSVWKLQLVQNTAMQAVNGIGVCVALLLP